LYSCSIINQFTHSFPPLSSPLCSLAIAEKQKERERDKNYLNDMTVEERVKLERVAYNKRFKERYYANRGVPNPFENEDFGAIYDDWLLTTEGKAFAKETVRQKEKKKKTI
jgi:hypothetical protein